MTKGVSSRQQAEDRLRLRRQKLSTAAKTAPKALPGLTRHFGDFANIDADYLVAIRKWRARHAFEHNILRNLANGVVA
jgi:hypothetical protein